MSDFDRYSLTIARWLTHVQDAGATAENYTTPRDLTLQDIALRAAKEVKVSCIKIHET